MERAGVSDVSDVSDVSEMGLARRGGWARAAWIPAVVVFAALGALLGGYLARGGDVRDFLHIAPSYLQQGGDASAIIRYDPSYRGYARMYGGYDGQFYYFFAVDPLHAASYMDTPAYTISRPLYPMLARGLGLGQPGLVPWTLLLINWLAISATVLALGDMLRRRGLSPWLALLYALYPGTLVALNTDVTEPLAYALVALGLWLLTRTRSEEAQASGRVWAGLAFAAAVLTREITAVFPLALALGVVVAGLRAGGAETVGARLRRVARPALWLAGVMAPFLAWKVVVGVWLGSVGVPTGLLPVWLPFQGLAQLWPWPGPVWITALFVGVPGALCLGLALWGLWRRPEAAEFWALGLNALFFCALLVPGLWDVLGSFRFSTGAALALLWAAPALARLAPRARLWMTGAFALWTVLCPLALAPFFPGFGRLLGLG